MNKPEQEMIIHQNKDREELDLPLEEKKPKQREERAKPKGKKEKVKAPDPKEKKLLSDPQSLQKAFVLKEILDAPVALRKRKW